MTDDNLIATPWTFSAATPTEQPRARLYDAQQHRGNKVLLVEGKAWRVPEHDRAIVIRDVAFIVLNDPKRTVYGYTATREVVIPESVARMVREAVGLVQKKAPPKTRSGSTP